MVKVIIALLIVALISISPIIAYSSKAEIEFTVKSKERIMDGNGGSMSSKYLIFTDTEVFENTDSLWYWKWNSSDVYNKIEVGSTYKAEIYGYRIPVLSMYRNILNINN